MQASVIARTFDAAGNMTQEPGGSVTYQWDAANRLKSINGGGNNQPAYHDALGRRIRKKTGPDPSPVYLYYFYDALGNVIMEKDGSSARLADHLYFAGERIGLYKPNLSTPTTYFLHKDHLGSTRLVTTRGARGSGGDQLLLAPPPKATPQVLMVNGC